MQKLNSDTAKPIENVKIEPEKISCFPIPGKHDKIIILPSKKVMEINSDFEVEYVPFT